MITASANTMLGMMCRDVDSLAEGEAICFSRHQLQDVETGPAGFAPEDRIMENIVGSSWSLKYVVDQYTGDVTYYRMPNDGRRYYTSPDRR